MQKLGYLVIQWLLPNKHVLPTVNGSLFDDVQWFHEPISVPNPTLILTKYC